MKNLLSFFKLTALGGLLVVLPLMVFYLLVGELLDLVVALAMPLVALFPENFFARVNAPLLVAVLLILAMIPPSVIALLIGVPWRKIERGLVEGMTLALKALAILVVVGLFSGALAALPRSGKWMIWVKRAAGILMIAVAQYYFVKAGYNL